MRRRITIHRSADRTTKTRTSPMLGAYDVPLRHVPSDPTLRYQDIFFTSRLTQMPR